MRRPVEPPCMGMFSGAQGLLPKGWKKIETFKVRRSGCLTEMYEGGFNGKCRVGEGSCVWVNTTDDLDASGRMAQEQDVVKQMEISATLTRAVYDGQWLDDKMHGSGTWCCSEGGRYVGQWQQGMRHGTGTMTYVDGSVYEGEWSLDLKEGQGCLTFASSDIGPDAKSDVYRGVWKQDELGSELT